MRARPTGRHTGPSPVYCASCITIAQQKTNPWQTSYLDVMASEQIGKDIASIHRRALASYVRERATAQRGD